MEITEGLLKYMGTCLTLSYRMLVQKQDTICH